MSAGQERRQTLSSARFGASRAISDAPCLQAEKQRLRSLRVDPENVGELMPVVYGLETDNGTGDGSIAVP